VPRAYVEWMLGFNRTYRGHRAEALRSFETAEELFALAGEAENRCAMVCEVARELAGMGQREAAWRRFGEAVDLAPALSKSRRIQALLNGIGSLLGDSGEHALAHYFLAAWVREAERSANPMSEALALSASARGWAALGRQDRASADLRRAFGAAAQIPGEGERDLTRVHVAVEQGAVLSLSGDVEGALAAWSRAAAFAQAAAAPLRLVEVLTLRAQLLRREGRDVGALDTLRRATEEVERQRSLLDDESQRISYLDQSRRVMEDLVSLLVDLGRGEEALRVAERMRTPELRATLERRFFPAGAPEWSLEPRSGQAWLVYLSLDRRLVIWHVDEAGVAVVTVDAPRKELESDIATLLDDLKRSAGAAYQPGAAAKRLSQRLVPQGSLAAVDQLLIVPDGPLVSLPFAALPVPGHRELLLDRVNLRFAPSLRVAAALRAISAGDGKDSRSTTLVVAATEHSSDAFPELPRLRPISGALLAMVGGPNSADLLTGASATGERFLREIALRDRVVVFAHALSSNALSSRTGLVLSPDGPADDGLLEPAEVTVEPGMAPRLVFLASCSGIGGPASPSEGALGVVRPLLAAGVSTVIASVGGVEERMTLDLLEAFFESRSSDPAEALRAAQRVGARSGRGGSWAFFQVHGVDHHRQERSASWQE
jgi:CHAT domain-containing protein